MLLSPTLSMNASPLPPKTCPEEASGADFDTGTVLGEKKCNQWLLCPAPPSYICEGRWGVCLRIRLLKITRSLQTVAEAQTSVGKVLALKAAISDYHKHSKVGQRGDKRRITYGKHYLLRCVKS